MDRTTIEGAFRHRLVLWFRRVLLVAMAGALAAPLGGCLESEKMGPMKFESGQYAVDPSQALTETQVRALQQRALLGHEQY
ncbi:MAG: hypothetical protein ACK5JT_00625 [Hyphomicrobiaceae bacterium]